LFGALKSGTSQRNLDPSIFDPALASNLTLMIQGLVVLIVSTDVIALRILRRSGSLLLMRRKPVAEPKEAES
jgi:simple sugar transport system permease protein